MARQRKPRPPDRPAAVSLPGAASSRTDGGPGSATQPIRVAAGQDFGDRQALEDQQRGAPLPDTTSGGPPPAAPVAAALGPVDPQALFAPSGQPGPGGPRPDRNFIPDDPDLLLKVIYQTYPHPEIRRLVSDIAR
jgi:hypothetical protein